MLLLNEGKFPQNTCTDIATVTQECKREHHATALVIYTYTIHANEHLHSGQRVLLTKLQKISAIHEMISSDDMLCLSALVGNLD